MMPDDHAKADRSESDRAAIAPAMAEAAAFRTNVRPPTAPGRESSPPAAARDRIGTAARTSLPENGDAANAGWVIETVVSPFHCLYQDALSFHTQSRLARSESEASRLARAALLLYVSSARHWYIRPPTSWAGPSCGTARGFQRPLPLFEAWRLLPAIAAQTGLPHSPFDPELPPWPQFAELLLAPDTRGPTRVRRRAPGVLPLGPSRRRLRAAEGHQVPVSLAACAAPAHLAFPRTGLPRDPYALRPRHLDAARGVLDAAIEALDGCMGGALDQGPAASPRARPPWSTPPSMRNVK